MPWNQPEPAQAGSARPFYTVPGDSLASRPMRLDRCPCPGGNVPNLETVRLAARRLVLAATACCCFPPLVPEFALHAVLHPALSTQQSIQALVLTLCVQLCVHPTSLAQRQTSNCSATLLRPSACPLSTKTAKAVGQLCSAILPRLLLLPSATTLQPRLLTAISPTSQRRLITPKDVAGSTFGCPFESCKNKLLSLLAQ